MTVVGDAIRPMIGEQENNIGQATGREKIDLEIEKFTRTADHILAVKPCYGSHDPWRRSWRSTSLEAACTEACNG